MLYFTRKLLDFYNRAQTQKCLKRAFGVFKHAPLPQQQYYFENHYRADNKNG